MQVSLEDVSVLKAFIYPEKIALVCLGSALSKKSFLSKFEIDVFSCIFRLWKRWLFLNRQVLIALNMPFLCRNDSIKPENDFLHFHCQCPNLQQTEIFVPCALLRDLGVKALLLEISCS